MTSTLQHKCSDVKLQLMYRITSTIQQLQSKMCEVNCFIDDNFLKISKSVLENIVGEVDLIQSQCQSLNKVMDDVQNNLSCDGGTKCYFKIVNTIMQIELWSYIFIFGYICVIKIISLPQMYLSSYSTSTYFHLVTLMAKCKLDRDNKLFPCS